MAHLQEAVLSAAHLQGATCDVFAFESSFAACIRQRIDRESDLSTATFAGGLSREEVDFLVKDISGERAELLRQILEPHIGKPASNELPKNLGAITGAYTKEEAERWIAEYEEAMGERPEAGEG